MTVKFRTLIPLKARDVVEAYLRCSLFLSTRDQPPVNEAKYSQVVDFHQD